MKNFLTVIFVLTIFLFLRKSARRLIFGLSIGTKKTLIFMLLKRRLAAIPPKIIFQFQQKKFAAVNFCKVFNGNSANIKMIFGDTRQAQWTARIQPLLFRAI